ncbi:hypothetical protein [Gilvimarinus chinensis]|uniref:hypothetical protein n=1 Tax=Gilvimarinus chinensis TaxID=396005 RepID=UPI00036CCD3D|nr:hypothetical protein [Gilvimarinus chinensis]
MIFRVFIIAVLVAQGLMAFAAPVAAPEMSVPAPSMAAMPECHQEAAENTPDTAMNAEHCTEQCCCPGVCNAALALPNEPFGGVYHPITVVSELASPLVSNPISRLYRPPIFA